MSPKYIAKRISKLIGQAQSLAKQMANLVRSLIAGKY